MALQEQVRSKKVRVLRNQSVINNSVFVDGIKLNQNNRIVIGKVSQFLSQKKLAIQNQHSLIKTNCVKAFSWSWEMLGRLVVMVETFGGMADQVQLCLKKIPKSAKDTTEESILPEQNSEKEYILVLDLDETLVHADLKKFSPEDFEVTVNTGDDEEKYYVRKRPYALQFIEKMAKIFDIYVFTAALKEYADKVLDWLDPQGLIKKRFYRDSCTKRDGLFLKDLTKIDTNLNKICIIDNSVSGFQVNPQNGMLIKSWYCDPNDKELHKYGNFLGENMNCKKSKWQKGNIQSLLDYLKKKHPRHILN